MSKELFKIREFLLKQRLAAKGAEKPLSQRRAEADGAMEASVHMGSDVEAEPVDAGGLPSLWVRAGGVPKDAPVVVYFHGGGFFSGSPSTHRGLAAAISAASASSVLLPGYRLAPEHRYPAAHEDALAACRWLAKSGVPAGRTVLAGDSAGAMLALAAAQTLRDGGESLPAAAVLLSPWLDISDFTSETLRSVADLDPMVDADTLRSESEAYFGQEETRRAANVLHRGMEGLPPLFIQCGEREVLRGDGQRLAEEARESGVDATLEVWPELWHIFQALTAMLPEAREAVGHIGGFIKSKVF